jgi:hypothetical protein
MVYKSTKDFIREHYGRYGLDANLIQYLEELPRQLHLRLRKGEDFWQEELENCQSKIHELDLISGSIRYDFKVALSNSKKTHANICYYLRKSIERDSILNWLAQYIKNMLHEYYNLS